MLTLLSTSSICMTKRLQHFMTFQFLSGLVAWTLPSLILTPMPQKGYHRCHYSTRTLASLIALTSASRTLFQIVMKRKFSMISGRSVFIANQEGNGHARVRNKHCAFGARGEWRARREVRI